MVFLNCIMIILWLLIVPFLIGILIINQLVKDEETDLLTVFVCGGITMMAIFYLLVIPMQIVHLSLATLTMSWGILMMVICALSLFFNRHRFGDILKSNFGKIKLLSWFAILIIVLILAQAFILASYQHEDSDDAFYIANATTAVATDSIFQFDPYTGTRVETFPANYVYSPFPIYIAMFSKLLLIHPTIIAHTILPAVLIPLAYAVLALIGKKMFPGNVSAVLYFLFFLCVLNIFGNFSVYTNSTFLLVRIWQGKAVLANIILPVILYFSFRSMQGKDKFSEWSLLFACALSACLVSSMGIILAPIMIFCLGFAFAVRNRNVRTLVYSIICCAPCILFGILRIVQL